jgi:hypothetical protein
MDLSYCIYISDNINQSTYDHAERVHEIHMSQKMYITFFILFFYIKMHFYMSMKFYIFYFSLIPYEK